jgi:hypothetical protein
VRYAIAMGLGLICGLAAAALIAGPVASWVVRQFEFDGPDTVAALHAAVFMAVNIAALVAGWLIGWALARPRAGRA